jgi:hypothetical protein
MGNRRSFHAASQQSTKPACSGGVCAGRYFGHRKGAVTGNARRVRNPGDSQALNGIGKSSRFNRWETFHPPLEVVMSGGWNYPRRNGRLFERLQFPDQVLPNLLDTVRRQVIFNGDVHAKQALHVSYDDATNSDPVDFVFLVVFRQFFMSDFGPVQERQYFQLRWGAMLCL